MEAIKDWMTTEVKTARIDETVLDAAKQMNEHHIGTLIVVEDQKPTGIITERDILNKVVAQNKEPGSTLVGEIMTKEIKTADIEADIPQISKVMNEQHIKRVPIINANGELVGVVTSTDLMKIMAKQWASDQ